jgi:ribosomal protein L18
MDKKAADKKTVRLRRGLRTRHKIRELGVHRLCVHRTPSHIYAQIIRQHRAVTRRWLLRPLWNQPCVRRLRAREILKPPS